MAKIVVLGTGGTIAGTAAAGDDLGYTAAQLGVAQLLDSLPALPAALGGCELVCEQVAQIDSKDMDLAVWQKLLSRSAHWLAQQDVLGIIITHGTDTVEETAYFLHRLLAADKPVVLTCAMRPATAVLADGPQNLLDAVAVVRHPGARGVVLSCAGRIHSALDAQKSHPWRLDAFDSGDAGPIGLIEYGQLRLLRDWPLAPAPGPAGRLASATAAPWVEIVVSHAAASGRAVDALVAQGVQGLVVAGTGNGSLHHALEAALLRARCAGVAVLRATRCAQGRVWPKPDDVLPDSSGLSPVKARVELLLRLLG